MPFTRSLSLALLGVVGMVAQLSAADKPTPIQIAEIKHEGPVDFEKEVLPVLRRNCLACHSATEAESDLVLETPQTILKGGSEGPAVVAGKSAESLLLMLAAHQKDPIMPPAGNDVKAKNLTADELGLIKLWIDQGAQGDVKSTSGPLVWQPLPAGVNPIYAVTITPDGQYAAASRANQIFLYHLPSKRDLGRLTDPSLLEKGVYTKPGVADLDLIQALRFSPDGQWLASGGYRTVKLWKRPASGKKLDLAGLESQARSIAVSADGKLAALGEESGKIKIFDVATGQVVKKLEGHTGPVRSVIFSTDGSKLVSASADKTFRVWNLADGQQIASVETPAPLNAVALVAEEKQIATGGEDNIIRLWDVPAAQPTEAPKPAKELAGHGAPVTSIAALAGGKLLSGSRDNTVRVWDLTAGNAVQQMNHGGAVESIAVRADGKRYASVSSNNTAKLWNAENQQQVAEMRGDFRVGLKLGELTRTVNLAKKQVELAKNDLMEATKRKTAEEENDKKSKESVVTTEKEFQVKTEAAKQPMADKIVTDKALEEATAAKTKADEGKKVADDAQKAAQEALTKAQQARDEANKGDKAEVKAAAEKAFQEADAAKKKADEAKQLADKAAQDALTAFNQADQKVKQLQPGYQKAIDELTAADRAFKAAQRSVERAAESVKKATEALPGYEQIVKTFEEAAKARETELQTAQQAAPQADKPIKACAFSPNGALLATVGDDQLLHTWDSETGAAVGVYSGSAAVLNVVAFTTDGNALTAAADNTAAIWDFATEWKLAKTFGNVDDAAQLVDRVTAIDFSPDGKTLATGGGEPSRSGELKLWDLESGQLKLAIKEPHSDTVNSVQFSPDGQQLATSGADRFVKLFNVADGKFIRSFEGHTHHVLSVAWRADGRLLVSSGADNSIKVWDARTGDQARTIQGFEKEVSSVRFVGEGDVVIAGSGDRKVRMVNAANGGNVRDYPGMLDFVYAADASADGKTVIAGGQDSILRVWNEQAQPFATFEAPKVDDKTAAK
jgi:WD40 repeat protein